jgi:hypothetical protein
LSTGNPPAGYYADPSIPGYIRYWDGTEWVAGTSRPAPDEVSDQVLASSQTDAVAGQAEQSSSGTWQPQPAAAASPAGQPDPLERSSGRSQSGARGYAQNPATSAAGQQQQAQPQPVADRPQTPVPQQQPQFAPQQAQTPAPQPQQQFAPQQAQPQPAVQQQPQQFAPRPAPAPAAAPIPRQAEPEPAQVPESVATMIVPSAFAPSQRTGTYRLPGNINNPFAGLPGAPGFNSAALEEDEDEREATVVQLATPGSRILGRIIDLGIAAIFSAPITVTLLLVAHRHDHQYVLKLDAEATSTYTTLGMDGLGIALWAGALLAFLLVSIVYEGYRLGRGGQTFGKRLAGVRVVRLSDGIPLARGGAGLRRSLVFWVCALIPVVDVLALGGVFWGRPYRQGVHEKASSTVTVKA